MKIWIVTGSSGSYDYFYKYNIKGFTSEEVAKAFIEAQPKIDYAALQELDELKWRYIDLIDTSDCANWTENQWDLNDRLRTDAEEKAIKEIQAKYPDADLTADADFNGYSIEELEVEE